MKRLKVTQEPKICPSCGFQPVGTIFYGTPQSNPELNKKIMDGTVILGGVCGGTHRPKWACKNCGCEFMHEVEETF